MAQGSKTPPEVEEKVWASWQLTQSYLETARATGQPYATVRGIVLRLAGGDANLDKVRQSIRTGMAEEAADRAMELVAMSSDFARLATATPESAAHTADALARAGASAARVAEMLARVGDKAPPGPQKLEILFRGAADWCPAPGSGDAPPDAGGRPGGDGHDEEPPVGGAGPVPGDEPGGDSGGDGSGT